MNDEQQSYYEDEWHRFCGTGHNSAKTVNTFRRMLYRAHRNGFGWAAADIHFSSLNKV
jgi:hypothetical protein